MATATQPPKFDRDAAQRRVRHPLQSLRGYIRSFVTLEGVSVALLFLALWFWIGIALDYGIFQLLQFDWIQELQTMTEDKSDTDYIIRLVLLIGLSVTVVVMAGMKIIGRFVREFNDPTLALVLERRFPKQLGDRLITAVEMADPRLSEKYGYSQALVDKTVQDAADEVEKLPVREVFAWGRLWKLFFLCVGLTLGLYLLVGVIYMGVSAVTGGRPMSYFGRFYNVSAIWFERNILLQDTYWPRRCYLEVIRFQESKKHPGEMRVALESTRPEVQVRAFKWIVGDHSAPGGWRPMRWSDLSGDGVLADYGRVADLAARVDIPDDWGEWIIDLDDLDSAVSNDVLPNEWRQAKSKDIQKQIDTDAMKKLIEEAQIAPYVLKLLDWRMWNVDQVEQQLGIRPDTDDEDSDEKTWRSHGPTGEALRKQHPAAHQALLELFKELEDLAETGGMERTLRQLEIPDKVSVYFRGETKKKSFDVEQRQDQSTKYAIGLNDIDESGRFTVRGEDYYTPYKKITLVPPPTLSEVTADIEAPAYQYYRLPETKEAPGYPESQMPLKGLRQKFRVVGSATGTTEFRVPIGSSMIIAGRAEEARPLKPTSLRMSRPKDAKEGTQKPEVKIHFEPELAKWMLQKAAQLSPQLFFTEEYARASGNPLPLVEVVVTHLHAAKLLERKNFDGKRPGYKITPAGKEALADEKAVDKLDQDGARMFCIRLDSVSKIFDFLFEYEDEDNVYGKRRVKIEPVIDGGPREDQEGFEAPAFLLKAKGRLPTSVREEKSNEDVFLITPVALIQFDKGRLRDDIGLAKLNWNFTYKQVIFEVVTSEKTESPDGVPEPKNEDKKEPDKKKDTDKKKVVKPADPVFPEKRGTAPLADFERRIKAGASRETALTGVPNHLYVPKRSVDLVPPELFPRTHLIRDERDGFDVKKFIPGLREEDSLKLQLHYVVTVGVSAMDNNVETGPTAGGFQASVKFLVVSESELLLLVFKEETNLRAKLERVSRKAKDGQAAIDNLMKNIGDTSYDLSLAGITAGNVRNMVEDSKGVTKTEVHKEYESIVRNLEANRVQKDKLDQTADIELRLSALVRPNGTFDQTEAAVASLKGMVEVDDAKKRHGNPPTLAQARAAKRQVDTLVNDIDAILSAMTAGLDFAKLKAEGDYIQQMHTRQAVERMQGWHKTVLDYYLKELMQKDGKKDDGKKKNEQSNRSQRRDRVTESHLEPVAPIVRTVLARRSSWYWTAQNQSKVA